MSLNNLTKFNNNLLRNTVPLGEFVGDSFDRLPSEYYVWADATAVLRSALDSSLLSQLIKTVTSIDTGLNKINVTAHGKANGDLVKFGFTLAGGEITANVKYYVRNQTTDAFEISATPTGAIIDLLTSTTGEMLTNCLWGFGDGSTTINVPDRRGKLLRAAGVNATDQKANGGFYDGGAVGETQLDRFQGHLAETGIFDGTNATASSVSSVSPAGSPTSVQFTLVTDGINGPPRTSDQTADVTDSIKEKVRIA